MPQRQNQEKIETKKEPTPRIRIKDPAPAEDKARAELQKSLDNEKRLRLQSDQNAVAANQRAEQFARDGANKAAQLRAAQESQEAAQLNALETGIADATNQMGAAQKEIATAMSEGNFEKVAEAQTKLARASSKLDRLEANKEDFVASKERRDAAADAVIDETVTTNTNTLPPIEQFVARMAPQSQKWLREHAEYAPAAFGGDDAKNAQMMRGHYDALSKGYAANTDDYFRIIEESVGIREAQAEQGEDVPIKSTKKIEPQRQASPSAPPSRTPPGSPQSGQSRSVRLTLAEQETAKFSFPHLKPNEAFAEYAKNKVALDAEGKLGRTSH